MQIPTHVWFIVGCHLRDCWLTVQRNNKVRYHTNRFKLINDALKMRSVYVAVTTFKQQCDSLACFVFAFGRQTTWFPVVQHISMENHCKVLSESACVRVLSRWIFWYADFCHFSTAPHCTCWQYAWVIILLYSCVGLSAAEHQSQY